jgi:iron complex transport system ATP-binding protein
MGPQKKIEIRNARLGYKKSGKEIVVLDKITLDFFAGDFVGIVGLNGSGKSTLLKSISGLLPLLDGEVSIDGAELSHTSLAELSRKIAVVLTEKFGGFNLTAYDVVAAGQIPYTNAFNQLKQEHRAMIDYAIKACGIIEHQAKPVNELSDGLFQKTIIAKALAQQTAAILLDEPSAFLDYASKHDLFILLKTLAEREHKCILVSSHDLDLLVKYCSKLLIVSGGTVELIPASEAQQNPAFKKIGGGFI